MRGSTSTSTEPKVEVKLSTDFREQKVSALDRLNSTCSRMENALKSIFGAGTAAVIAVCFTHPIDVLK